MSAAHLARMLGKPWTVAAVAAVYAIGKLVICCL